MSARVVVVDYGVGNLHSVQKAFKHAGAEVVITSDPEQVRSADRLILPGVGAFADAMRELSTRGLVDAVKAHAATGRPFMGICVGMQLLLAESTEFGRHAGLGVIPGTVEKIPDHNVKVPHVGWNAIAPPNGASWRGSPLEALQGAEGADAKPMVYFVHSFNAVPANESDRLADAAYGDHRICAGVRRDNVFGFQFHPEKSGPVGLRILERFLAI